MGNDITAFVGLDVHEESVAIAVAGPARIALRFVGTIGPQLAQVFNAPSHVGRPEQTLVAYRAGPCGCGLVWELTTRGYCC